MIEQTFNEFHVFVLVGIGVLTFLISWFVTGRVREYALRANMLDTPNARSSHLIATPRGGGLAVILAVASAIFFLAAGSLITRNVLVAGCLMCVMSAMGWVDDRRGLTARFRLLVQATCSVVLVALAASVGSNLGFFGVLWLLALVLFIIWMTNLYNFMDGIDGIFGIQAVAVALGNIVLMWPPNFNGEVGIYMSILGAALGFLVWNWSPAKIFLGDVGSASLGFLFAALAVIAVFESRIGPVAVLILNAAFVGDATVTLAVRMCRGQRIHEAHKSHFYQKLHQSGQKPAYVASLFGLYNIFWLLPLAYFYSAGVLAGWLGLVLAYGPIFIAAAKYRAGVEGSIVSDQG